MKIFVKTFTNKTLGLNIRHEDDITSIKKQIELLEQISISHQRLIYMGVELKDRQSVAQYNIQAESTIICESNVLLITLPDTFTTVLVESGDTINNVKRKIHHETGIPINSQRMFYSCCFFRGKQLDDSKTISENNIGSNLVHVLQAVQGGMQIFVEILEKTRTIMHIPVSTSDTVLQIKKKIQGKFTHNITQYKLFIHDNEMNDNKTLAEYNIKNETVLQLCKNKIIFVKRLTGEMFELQVNKSDTIELLKTKIEQKIGVPSKLQTLYFHNTELNVFKTLAEYDIGFGMKVELKTGKRVFISSVLRIRMVIELQELDTARKLKEAIKGETGVPEEYQHIFRGNSELHDGHSYFEENETLKLMICSEKNELILNVFVQGTGTFSTFIKALRSDNIINLKQKVKEESGISVEKYICYFENKQLQNNSNLSYRGITNMSVLHLCESHTDFIKIFIRNFSTRKVYPVMVSILDTVEYLKIRIEQMEGIPLDQQRLIAHDKQLEDTAPLQRYNIQANDEVHVVLRLRGC